MDNPSERYKELHNKKVRLTPFTINEISDSPIQPARLQIAVILEKLGLTSFDSYEEVQGGRDSQVFKVSGPGAAYALRLLPSRKYDQFIKEKKMMDIAARNGVPIPKVYSIQKIDGQAAMLMEWREGQTVLAALMERPEIAEKLGKAFGRVQARINGIPVPPQHEEPPSWLTPASQEAEVLSAVPASSMPSVLLHLDYHPLNTLTDGENITAVLDWANAAFGDCRFDVARTFSIFQLAEHKIFEKNPQILADFEKGWKTGYAELAGPFEQFGSMELFYAWSGIRLKRDSEARLNKEEKAQIDAWVAGWLSKGENQL